MEYDPMIVPDIKGEDIMRDILRRRAERAKNDSRDSTESGADVQPDSGRDTSESQEPAA